MLITGKAGLGKPTAFDFKHVPQLGKTTRKEEKTARNQEFGDTGGMSRLGERVLLTTFIIGCSFMILVSVTIVKAGIVTESLLQRASLLSKHWLCR